MGGGGWAERKILLRRVRSLAGRVGRFTVRWTIEFEVAYRLLLPSSLPDSSKAEFVPGEVLEEPRSQEEVRDEGDYYTLTPHWHHQSEG